MKAIDKKVLIISEESTLNNVIEKLVNNPKPYFGFACIVDSDYKLTGVFNSGDLFRALNHGFTLDCQIHEIMTKSPIFIYEDELQSEIIKQKLKSKFFDKFGLDKNYTKCIPVINREGILKDILTYEEIVNEIEKNNFSISIWGLGYVGLTLLAAIGSKGIQVIGIDKSEKLIKSLKDNNIHVHEPGIKESIQLSKDNKVVNFSSNIFQAKKSNVHIICVGTPIDDSLNQDLSAIKNVSKNISKIIKNDDLILIRSTVPIGTSRNVIIPILEESKLKAGKDFFVAFTPERTVEGNALEEIFTIPQIIGGFTSDCLEKSELFWQNITNTTVSTSNLEAAEITKLLNNSFRDLTFGFSNAFVEVATSLNLEANKIIRAANSGYVRGNIPISSPGVGGYCLTKDPYIYGSFDTNLNYSKLAHLTRNINKFSAEYPYKMLTKFCKIEKLSLSDLNVFIIGIAFKGDPPTNDLRESSSIYTYDLIAKDVKKINCFDHVLSNSEYECPAFLNFAALNEVKNADAIFILNNHQLNVKGDFFKLLNKKKKLFIFDGWGQIQKHQIENNKLWTYSTLGYMTIKNE